MKNKYIATNRCPVQTPGGVCSSSLCCIWVSRQRFLDPSRCHSSVVRWSQTEGASQQWLQTCLTRQNRWL